MKGTARKTETFIDDRPGYNPALEQIVGSVRNVPWSDEEEETLKRYYGKVPTADIVKALGRSPAGIGSKVREFGLKFPTKKVSKGKLKLK